MAKWVENGPDLKTDGVARWRRAGLRDRIAAKFNIHLHERGVGKPLKKLNFSSMPVRPAHPQSGLEARQAFKKTSPGSWKRRPQKRRAAIPQELAGKPVEIWFQDEPSIRHTSAIASRAGTFGAFRPRWKAKPR